MVWQFFLKILLLLNDVISGLFVLLYNKYMCVCVCGFGRMRDVKPNEAWRWWQGGKGCADQSFHLIYHNLEMCSNPITVVNTQIRRNAKGKRRCRDLLLSLSEDHTAFRWGNIDWNRAHSWPRRHHNDVVSIVEEPSRMFISSFVSSPLFIFLGYLFFIIKFLGEQHVCVCVAPLFKAIPLRGSSLMDSYMSWITL